MDQPPEIVRRLRQGGRVPNPRPKSHGSPLLGLGDDRVEDAGLGLELVVARSAGDPGPRRDVIDARVMKAAFNEQIASTRDDLGADLSDVLLRFADFLGPG